MCLDCFCGRFGEGVGRSGPPSTPGRAQASIGSISRHRLIGTVRSVPLLFYCLVFWPSIVLSCVSIKQGGITDGAASVNCLNLEAILASGGVRWRRRLLLPTVSGLPATSTAASLFPVAHVCPQRRAHPRDETTTAKAWWPAATAIEQPLRALPSCGC